MDMIWVLVRFLILLAVMIAALKTSMFLANVRVRSTLSVSIAVGLFCTAPDDSVDRLAHCRIFRFPLSCEINKLSSAAGLSRHGGGDNSCGAALQVPAVLTPVANRETLCRIN